jgi:hypothetical protein
MGMKPKADALTYKVATEIIKGLQEEPYMDLSDVGNIIGIVLGNNYISKSSDDGNDLKGFLFGINHGIDLKAKSGSI